MANGVFTVTTSSQILVDASVSIDTFVATNTGTNPIYIRYSEPGSAVAGQGIALLFNGSSCAIQKENNYAVSVISSGGSSTLSYYYQ